MRARSTSYAQHLALAALLWSGALAPTPVRAGTGWIPPRAVTALLPSATFAPGTTHSIDLTLRANGAATTLDWTAAPAGSFALTVVPASGSITVPADSVRRVTLSVTIPPSALGVASLGITLTNQIGGGEVAECSGAIYAATDGRPEIWPVPSSWAAVAGTAGSVGFEIHSQQGTAELLALTSGRTNPDPNNTGALFPGGPPPASVNLPGGATIAVTAPTTIAGSAFGGNANSVQLTVTSDAGISTAGGLALVSAALPESLPAAMVPIGLTPMSDAAGRDGPKELSGRGLWLVPAGLEGVQVIEAASLGTIGAVDLNGDGTDDRLVGTVRIPSYAAALDVVPDFVSASGDTLDLGLLAAGRSGLMLLDLRAVVDPPFGTWEDFFDHDGNGIDDRILRTIPLPGFATDAAWFRAPSGRVVALVADADTGSVPVAATYDPALVAAGTGAGVVAVDVAAALDSLGGVPYAAGTLSTAGNTLDLELRGGSAPDLAIADGDGGVAVYHLIPASGAPATVTFVPRGSVALSAAWGVPYARDIAWVSNTSDSSYLAVAAGAAGLQIVRAVPGMAPVLVLAQQTASAAVGLAGAWTGTLAAATGAGGVALLRAPGAAELDQIAAAGPPPYTAPVVLSRGQSWTEGWALETASHWTPSASATSLKFLATAGPIPDLLVSDGPRALLLHPGQATIVAVETLPSPPRAPTMRVVVVPNPVGEVAEIRVFDPSPRGDAQAGSVRIFDLHGRLVRRFDVPGPAAAAGPLKFTWDGRDGRGRRVGSGRYWVRFDRGSLTGSGAFLLLR